MTFSPDLLYNRTLLDRIMEMGAPTKQVDSGWQDLTLNSPFVVNDDKPLQWHMTADGFIHLRGQITSTDISYTTNVFTGLPEPYSMGGRLETVTTLPEQARPEHDTRVKCHLPRRQARTAFFIVQANGDLVAPSTFGGLYSLFDASGSVTDAPVNFAGAHFRMFQDDEGEDFDDS